MPARAASYQPVASISIIQGRPGSALSIRQGRAVARRRSAVAANSQSALIRPGNDIRSAPAHLLCLNKKTVLVDGIKGFGKLFQRGLWRGFGASAVGAVLDRSGSARSRPRRRWKSQSTCDDTQLVSWLSPANEPAIEL